MEQQGGYGPLTLIIGNIHVSSDVLQLRTIVLKRLLNTVQKTINLKHSAALSSAHGNTLTFFLVQTLVLGVVCEMSF